MRQLFNQLMGKKPTMLTPSQMAMGELSSGMQQWQDDEKKKKLPIPRADYLEGRELTNEEAQALGMPGPGEGAPPRLWGKGERDAAIQRGEIASGGDRWFGGSMRQQREGNAQMAKDAPMIRAMIDEAQARRGGRPAYDTTPEMPTRPEGTIAPPDTSGLINTIDLRGGGTASATPNFDIGGQTAPRGALGMDTGGGMGSMAMGALGGASGALDGIMSDAQKNVGGGIKDNFDSRNPIRDATLARARSGQAVPMRGLRYGGYVAPGEEVLVGEVAPEKVIARPDGGVEVVPLDAPQAMADDTFTAQERGMMDAPRMSRPEPIGLSDGIGYDQNAHSGNGGGDGFQRPVGTETVSGISDITIDEGSAPPPRRSLLDTKRIIARNNDGLTDEGVWQAREDVLKEDQWRALNEPVKKSKWKDIGMMLLTSLNNQVNNRQDPVRTWGEIKRDEKVGALSPQLQVLQQRRAEKDARAKGELDRELLRKRAEDYTNDEVYRRDALAQRKREAFRRANPSFDATKATDAQKRALAEFGESPESVGTYDFSKPDTKMVAGTLYQRNPNTGAYEDTGVKDPSKQVVEYTIVDPDTGVAQKYATTSERAASLKTQLKAAGMQIQAATERLQSTQQHSEKMMGIRNEAERRMKEFEAIQKEIAEAKDQKRKIELEGIKAAKQKDLIRFKKAIEDKDEGFTWVGNATGTAIPDKP